MPVQNLNLQDLQKIALQFVGDSLSSNYTSVTLLNYYLNAALQEIVTQELGVEDIERYIAVVNQRAYPLPPGYTKVKLVFYNGTPLRYCRVIDQDFFDQGNTYPDRFSLWNDKVLLGSLPPSATDEVKVYYWREPRVMAANTDIPEIPNRYRFGIACYAGAMMATGDVNQAQVQMLMAEFNKAKQGYREWEDSRSTQTLQVRNADADWLYPRGGY